MPAVSRRAFTTGSLAALAASAVSTMTPARAYAAGASSRDSETLFARESYIGRGTVFTRSVANMPLDPNSSAMAATMKAMPATYIGSKYPGKVTTAATGYANIPTYVVDSRDPACEYITMKLTSSPSLRTGVPAPAFG